MCIRDSEITDTGRESDVSIDETSAFGLIASKSNMFGCKTSPLIFLSTKQNSPNRILKLNIENFQGSCLWRLGRELPVLVCRTANLFFDMCSIQSPHSSKMLH